MALLFIIPFIYLLFNTKYHIKDFNKDYLNKTNTQIVNALFIIIVFFRHFSQYVGKPSFIIDRYFFKGVSLSYQLIVVTFLFFSGYGIYECIKNKKNYIKDFGKKRFLKTYLNFVFAIVLFVIMNLLIGKNYGTMNTILAFTGYESIGNSNWYMLLTFVLYIFIMFAFNITKDNKKALIIITILSIIYALLITYLKSAYCGDTALCFVAGMWYSYYKEKIDKVINNKNYLLLLVLFLILFIVTYFIYRHYHNVLLFNAVSIIFMLFIVLLLMKLELNGKILLKLGELLFWVYILQRIPMAILSGYNLNMILYFYICFIVTVLLSIICNKLTNRLFNPLFK